MRNPAEVFLLKDFESGCLERRSIFLKRRNIALGRILDRAFQFTSKSGKPIVHINVDANSSGPQQAIDVRSAVIFFPKPMAIPEGVNPHDQVEITDQVFDRCAPCRGQILCQLLVAGNMKAQFLRKGGVKRRLGLLRADCTRRGEKSVPYADSTGIPLCSRSETKPMMFIPPPHPNSSKRRGRGGEVRK